ncbi:MAG: FAD-dependent oxidoreductase, partial [Polaromonas sp.]
MANPKYSVLPKGVSERNFDAALQKFREIVGAEQVLTSAERLVSYNKIMMPVDDAKHAPSAVLLATTVEQIQAIVKVCNTYKVPIWTISTGRNFGYGSAAPGERGQVVLDLRKMNKILHIDADLCTALVEPGVTYQQLYDYIEEHKLPLMLS